MSIDFTTPIRTTEIRVTIANYGPAVRGVKFTAERQVVRLPRARRA